MILFVEDSHRAIENFKPLLEKYDKVHLSTFYHDAMRTLRDNKDKIKVIVCDHNFPIFKGEFPQGLGQDIYFETQYDDWSGTFIHFSSEPCPEKYQAQDDQSFISIKKSASEASSFQELEENLKNVYKNS